MKKIILCIIFSLLYFTACDLIFGSYDDSEDEPEAPKIISLKPLLAFDESGNAIAVWHQNDGTNYNIWSNRFTVSTEWETAEPVMKDNINDSIFPKIAMNNSGKAVVVWEQKDNIMVNIWTDGSGWGDAELIEKDENGDVTSPDIAIDSSGKIIAVWSQFDGKSYSINSKIYSGTEWGSAEIIESNDDENDKPNVEFYSSSNAIVVWHQKNETSESIYANTYSNETGWGIEKKIGLNEVDAVYKPQIAIDPSGNVIAMALWGRYENETWKVYSNIFGTGLTWGTAAPIPNNVSEGEYDPQVAFDGNGNAIAVWRNFDGKNYIVNSMKFDKDTGWTSQIETISEADREIGSVEAFNPRIASHSSGNAIVVWHQYDQNKWKIYSNRYVPGAGWNGVEVIGESDLGDAIHPSIAYDSSGNAIVLWNQNNESIWAKRFDGTVWGDAVQISLIEDE